MHQKSTTSAPVLPPQQNESFWRMSVIASGKILLGGLVASDILMAANYMARDRDIALWWLGLLFAGGLAAELVDRLGKAEHERPAYWTDDLSGYFNYLCERSGRMMWRWAEWTLVASAAHLLINMNTSGPIDSLTALTERFRSDIGNIGLAWLWALIPFLFFVAAVTVFALRRFNRPNCLMTRCCSNPLALSLWCVAVGLFGVPFVLFVALNLSPQC